MNLNDTSYWWRLTGANVLSGIFAPSHNFWLVDLSLHLLVVLGLMLLTCRSKPSPRMAVGGDI